MKRFKLLRLIVVVVALFTGLGTISSQAQVTFEHYKTLKGNSSGITTLSFSPDGRYLASGSMASVTLWDVNSGQKIKTLQAGNGEITYIKWGENGNVFASISGSGNYIIWELNTWEKKADGFEEIGLVINEVATSNDEKYLAARGKNNREVIIRSPYDKAANQTLRGHSERVDAVQFSEDGKYLASGSADGTIIIWKQKEDNSYQNSENDYYSHSIPEIYSIEIANGSTNELTTDYGKPIYFYETMYLFPKIRYKSNENGKYRFDILVRDSSGNRIKGLPDPYQYTYYSDVDLNYGEGVAYLVGWGSNNKGSVWKAGDYYIEIWYRSCKLQTLKFTIY